MDSFRFFRLWVVGVCTSKTEGGKRCAAVTRGPYRALVAEINDCGDWSVGARTFEDRLKDVVEYARTKKGRSEVEIDLRGHEHLFKSDRKVPRELTVAHARVLALFQSALNEAARLNDVEREFRRAKKLALEDPADCAHDQLQEAPVVLGSIDGAEIDGEESAITVINPDQFFESLEAEGEPEDYRMNHRAPGPDYGAPFDDVEEMMPDYYTRPDFYRHDPQVDRECVAALRAARGNPEATVTVYRALPVDFDAVNDGDWVTPSLAYAKGHAASEGTKFHIVAVEVPARTLWTEGYAAEWGYNGPGLVGSRV